MSSFIRDQENPTLLHPLKADLKTISPLWPQRDRHGHKGTFGKVLLVGGSLRMQGALNMAAQACFRSGCGTITLFTPQDAAKAIAAKTDLAMIIAASQNEEGYFDKDAYKQLPDLNQFDVIACGNGMGTQPGGFFILRTILHSNAKVIIDADGINVFAKHREELLPLVKKRNAPVIMTPHMMEFARLCDKPLPYILENSSFAAQTLCQEYPNLILLTKSDCSSIYQNGKVPYQLNRPDSALSKGGSGDVLCGIVTGLCAWVKDPFLATVIGAVVHNEAARQAKSPVSFTPTDLIQNLSDVYATLDQR